uniref:Glycosyl transferase family 25 domain-containing protein n=1 Tax=viral metagenome TaxID=1070528 RepID=A0A6C0K1X8_9ZZZZ
MTSSLPVQLVYINLASRKDRQERMEKMLKECFQKIPFERIEAVRPDGDLLLDYNRNGRLTNPDYLRVLSNETSFLTTGSVGCFASHIGLWKRAVESSTIFVILEDDVVLRDDIEKCLLEGIASLNDDFHIAYLGQPMNRWTEYASSWNDIFWKITQGYHGTFGYMIHPSHAAFLLKCLETIPMTEHVDNAMLRVQANENIPVLLFRTTLLTTPTDPGRDSDVMCSRRRRRLFQTLPLTTKIPRIVYFLAHGRVEEQKQHWQNLHPDDKFHIIENEGIPPSTGGFYVAPGILCRRNIHPFVQTDALEYYSVHIDQHESSSALFYGINPMPLKNKTLTLPSWILGDHPCSLLYVDLKK